MVARELDLLRTSEIFQKRDSGSPLFTNLLAALSAYSAFYRSSHSDKETAAVKAEAECEIWKSVQRAEELAEECDSADAIRKVVTHYFGEKDNFEIFGVDEVDEISLGKLRKYSVNVSLSLIRNFLSRGRACIWKKGDAIKRANWNHRRECLLP